MTVTSYRHQELPSAGLTVMTITDTAIRNFKPQVKPIKLADGGGLYLLCIF
jgi:hypothetical protein